MKKVTLAALLTVSILAGCESGPMSNLFSNTTTAVTQQVLQQNSWQLESINGEALSQIEDILPVTLSINENFQVAGYNGCNNYFGTGELNANQFRINKMGSTKKACSPQETKIENAMTNVLSNWSQISIKDQKLILKNDSNTLVFKFGS